MRLEKIKENEKVQHYYFLDYINCGEYYLLTRWINEQQATVTLNQNTNLEDLHKKHGGSILYSKLCSETFRVYKSMSGEFCERDMDKVIDWTRIDHYDRYHFTHLLKALLTGVGLEELTTTPCIVRWASEGNSRGTDWYGLVKNLRR